MKNITHSIYHDFTIKASVDKVYDAITLPIHLNNWWPLKSSGIPEVGEIYNFNFTSEYDWFGKVITCVKNKSFQIEMTKSDENWNETRFGFELEQVDSTTKIKFTHINWKSCNSEFRQSSYCWAILLSGLKNYLEKGIIIPFEERE